MAEPHGPARWAGTKRSVQADQGGGGEGEGGEGTEVSWTDAAKTLADEHGIDINTVEGTGVDGRITKDDVQAVVDEQSA